MTKHNTKIEWTHIPGFTGETWNPIVGCDIVSKGCTNCYAMKWAAQRLDGNKNSPHYAGTTTVVNSNRVWTGKIAKASEKTLQKPLHWSKPRSIFVNSMGDLFHESVPDEWIDQVFAVMALCPQHIFMILTKRPERMREWALAYIKKSLVEGLMIGKSEPITFKSAFAHVWLGTSVEDQATANERIPHLLSTPAAVRFLSCEPLLGPVDLEQSWHGETALNAACWGECGWCDSGRIPLHNCIHGKQSSAGYNKGRSGLDWVIVGGESGKNARPMHPEWVRGLRDQCQDAGVPFFFKQWGEFVTGYFDGYEYEVDEDCHGHCEGRGVTPCHTNYDMDPLHYIRVGKSRAGNTIDRQQHLNWPNCITQKRSEVA